jgi:hypothetical protein
MVEKNPIKLKCYSCGTQFDYYLKKSPSMVIKAIPPPKSTKPQQPSPSSSQPQKEDSKKEKQMIEICLMCPGKLIDGRDCKTWNSFDIDPDESGSDAVRGFPMSNALITNHENWLTKTSDYIRGLADTYSNEADKFNTLFTAFFGLYTSILVFFGLSGEKTLISLNPIIQILLLLPIAAWIYGTSHLLLVKKPFFSGEGYFDSSKSYMQQFNEANKQKSETYSKAITAFALGVLLIIGALFSAIVVNALGGGPSEQTVQFIASETGYPILKSIPVPLDASNKTPCMSLTNTTDSGYQVKMSTGESFEIDKTWVSLMIENANCTGEASHMETTPEETSPVETTPVETPSIETSSAETLLGEK